MTTTRLSRRQALSQTAVSLAGATWAISSLAAAQQNKMTQKAAGYQNQPNGKYRCSGCSHFAVPNSCKIVEGEISPNGWCRMFALKQ